MLTPTNSPSSTTTTTYTYEYWDSAQQSQIKKAPSTGAPGYTYFYYDTNGHIRRSYDAVAYVDNYYFNTATGLVLQRDRYGNGASTHYFYYADDHRIGDVSDTPDDIQRVSYAEQLAMKPFTTKRSYYRLETIGQSLTQVEYQDGSWGEEWQNINQAHSTADFDQNYEPINDNYPGAAASSYTVRSDGETLAGIAQALWGDRSMWYLIADANGLTLSSALKAGQLLVIPNKVTNIHNNSSTWRPYNAGEAIGRTDPTVPVPPPPAKKGCGGIGTLIMVAVAVVATIVTAGAAAVALGAASLGTASVGVAMAATAAGAAVGSIASQAVGLAIGQIDSFSWKQVGQAAMGGAISGGIAAYAGTASSALQSFGGSSGWAASAGRAALSSAATMALKGDWSWRNVMISAVSAGVGQAVGSVVGGQAWAQAGNGIGARLTSGLAGSLVARSLTGGNRASFETVFASTLGNAIGESLANQPKSSSAYDYRNGSDVESDSIMARREALYGLDGSGARLGSSSGNAMADWSREIDRRIADHSAPLVVGAAANLLDLSQEEYAPFAPNGSHAPLSDRARYVLANSSLPTSVDLSGGGGNGLRVDKSQLSRFWRDDSYFQPRYAPSLGWKELGDYLNPIPRAKAFWDGFSISGTLEGIGNLISDPRGTLERGGQSMQDSSREYFLAGRRGDFTSAAAFESKLLGEQASGLVVTAGLSRGMGLGMQAFRGFGNFTSELISTSLAPYSGAGWALGDSVYSLTSSVSSLSASVESLALANAAARRSYLNEKFGRTGDLDLDINVRGRQEVATKFFFGQGVPEGKIPSYMTGIDFTRPVEMQTLGAGKQLWQYQAPGAPQGNWYSLTSEVQSTELGISPFGFNRATQMMEPKVLNSYLTTDRVSVLRSTAASVEDFWSVPGQRYFTTGGAYQLFSSQRPMFRLGTR